MSLTRRAFVGFASGIYALPVLRAFAQTDDEAAYFAGTVEDNGYVYRRTNMDRIDPVSRFPRTAM